MVKLTPKQAFKYKQSWKAVESFQLKELRAAPISLRFRQLCCLMDSFRFPSKDKKRDKEVHTIRQHWLALKKDQK